MAKLLRKLYVIIWKNFTVRRHHWALTIFEIFVPTLLIFAVTFAMEPEEYIINTIIYEAKDPGSLLKEHFGHFTSDIYYTPTTSFTDKLMTHMKDSFTGLQKCSIVGVKSENDIINAYQNTTDDDLHSFFGIIFENVQGDKVPTTLKYRLRTDDPMSIRDTFPLMVDNGPTHFSAQYERTGIGALQLFIDDTFINMVRNEKKGPHSDMKVNRLVQLFPYPKSKLFSYSAISTTLTVLFVIGFSFLCSSVLKRIVSEKETGVKELMKLMGLKSWMLWTSWLINALFVNAISVSVIVVILTHGVRAARPLELVDASLLWVFFMMFCVTSIFTLFAISSFFESATFAITFGIVLWFVVFVALLLLQNTDVMNTELNRLTCLIPHGGLIQGMTIVSQYEFRGIGQQWDNLFIPPSGGYGDLTMGSIFIMYLINIGVCGLITCYVDAVKPGKYGIAKPWYLCLGNLFSRKNSIESVETSPNLQRNFEPPPPNFEPGIQIKNLYKVYTSIRKSFVKVAVNGVTVDIYNGEITALLGHNGAGKTTVMSILAGMFSPTSGSVIINGYEIEKNLDKIRDNLGLCPQHNLHFSELTVKEHLLFFAMVRCGDRLAFGRESHSDCAPKEVGFAEGQGATEAAETDSV